MMRPGFRITALALLAAALAMNIPRGASAQDGPYGYPVNPLRRDLAAPAFSDNMPVTLPLPASNRPSSGAVGGLEVLVAQGVWSGAGPDSPADATGPQLERLAPQEHPDRPALQLSQVQRPVLESTIHDAGVQPASYAAPHAERPAELSPFSGPDSLDLSGTIKKISFALAVSLLGCVVVMVAARFFQQGRGVPRVASETAKNQIPPPRIEQTLSLGNKSLLRLVRVGNQQVLVATDATGIRSVLAIQPEFESMLQTEQETRAAQDSDTDLQKILSGFFARQNP